MRNISFKIFLFSGILIFLFLQPVEYDAQFISTRELYHNEGELDSEDWSDTINNRKIFDLFYLNTPPIIFNEKPLMTLIWADVTSMDNMTQVYVQSAGEGNIFYYEDLNPQWVAIYETAENLLYATSTDGGESFTYQGHIVEQDEYPDNGSEDPWLTYDSVHSKWYIFSEHLRDATGLGYVVEEEGIDRWEFDGSTLSNECFINRTTIFNTTDVDYWHPSSPSIYYEGNQVYLFTEDYSSNHPGSNPNDAWLTNVSTSLFGKSNRTETSYWANHTEIINATEQNSLYGVATNQIPEQVWKQDGRYYMLDHGPVNDDDTQCIMYTSTNLTSGWKPAGEESSIDMPTKVYNDSFSPKMAEINVWNVSNQWYFTINTRSSNGFYRADPYPYNETALSVGLNPSLSIEVNDSDGNLMNVTFRTNSSGSWANIDTNSSVSNGTYIQTTSGFTNWDTTYFWSINVSDGYGGWSNQTYDFTTGSNPNFSPIQDTESPTNDSSEVSISTSEVSVNIEDPNGDRLDLL